MRQRLVDPLVRAMDELGLVNSVANHEEVFNSDDHHQVRDPRVEVRVAETTIEQ